MFNNVIFDMDGVLINSEPEYLRRQLAAAREVGATPLSTNLQDYVGRASAVTWQTAVPENEALRQQAIDRFTAELLSDPIDYARIITPGVADLIKYLHAAGYGLGLASAASWDGVTTMLQETGLQPYFTSVVSGETLSANKPDPQVYLQNLAKLQADPARSLAIEDSPTGITAAHAAGMTAWALAPNDYTIDQTQADRVATSMLQIQDWLQQA
ncbi:HAD family phosphatase [Lacticaseibacillus pabuli]|uniref:HAD family phosphatase n=1 Tax=Lacticaseibacillus pabuli TaxID=3025672 RepID=A0ABY7WR86_9LACO|nr:HAD family phosphatase [Lacticaseibacillus sp. KACC 23028]WDF82698.1 HAD family phosphatase [Lacticaseibacillus sp. KACC 23028]